MKKPNIILFFSDQQRFDTLGCNGQPLEVTPRLDRMAREGVNFTMAYTPQPVCGPARAMLQSGLYPTQIGCFRNGKALPRDCNTLARRLKAAGYRVAYVGKWHLASERTLGQDKGREFSCETEPVPLERRGGYDEFWVAADVLEFTSHGYGGHLFDRDNSRRAFTGYRADCVTDHALEYLDTRSKDDEAPFFLFLSLVEPHHQNDRNAFEGPEGSRERYAAFVPPPDLPSGEGDWETQMPDYLGCCNALDRNLGRVLDRLKEKGIYDDTLVIYTTDHGCHFKTKQKEAIRPGFDDYKRNCHENTIHIPMVIRGPGFAAGAEERRLVSLLDIPKTIIAAAGGDTGGMHGDSLLNLPPIITDEAQQPAPSPVIASVSAKQPRWKQEVYIQISESFVGRAIRTDRYTYCVYAPDKDPVRDSASDTYRDRYLFDNLNDPSQAANLIDDPAYAAVKDDLRACLIACAQKAAEPPITLIAGCMTNCRG